MTEIVYSDEFIRTHSEIQLNPKTAFHNGTPYPVGLDPVFFFLQIDKDAKFNFHIILND